MTLFEKMCEMLMEDMRKSALEEAEKIENNEEKKLFLKEFEETEKTVLEGKKQAISQ